VAFAAMAGLFAAGMFQEDRDELPSALVGQVAPATAFAPLGTLPLFDPSTLADGEVKLVNFWASWCAPCRVEHPNLKELAATGLPIYGVNYRDEPEKALAFLAELGDPFVAAGSDPQGRAALDWGVYGLPETFVVDGEGRIVARMAGAITDRVYETRLRPALAEAGLEMAE
jgi:cytochrome c biogenesis protein CcmG/thiol:disulfide interchange protein DsbE